MLNFVTRMLTLVILMLIFVTCMLTLVALATHFLVQISKYFAFATHFLVQFSKYFALATQFRHSYAKFRHSYAQPRHSYAKFRHSYAKFYYISFHSNPFDFISSHGLLTLILVAIVLLIIPLPCLLKWSCIETIPPVLLPLYLVRNADCEVLHPRSAVATEHRCAMETCFWCEEAQGYRC